MSKIQSNAIAGFVKPAFEAVRAAFVENFTQERPITDAEVRIRRNVLSHRREGKRA
jgi:hypothetical protein